ncbi:hypothetical protein [Formosa sp. A9]|uniref:hypothetical protein n=1 Tax=Formosa sp. A9 TaxID=3442641 RepID=UPI003EBEDD12
MKKFAKLIDLENNEQVLLTIDYNDEDEMYEVETRTDFKGVAVSIKSGFYKEQDAIARLETFSVDDAKRFREVMSRLMN